MFELLSLNIQNYRKSLQRFYKNKLYSVTIYVQYSLHNISLPPDDGH
jgi:hypothetical protein